MISSSSSIDPPELGDEPALADSRHADERHELRRAVDADARERAEETAPARDPDRRAATTISPPRPPTRPRASTASQTSTGSALPFAVDRGVRAGRRSPARSRDESHSRHEDPVDRRRRLDPRRRVHHVPATIDSPAAGRASSATSASPVATPMRTWRSSVSSRSLSAAIASRTASAARTARSGSSSCAIGAP